MSSPPHPTSALTVPPPPNLPTWPPNFGSVLHPEGGHGYPKCGHPMARLGLGGRARLFELVPQPLSTPSLPGEKRRDAGSQAKWTKWERPEREDWEGKERRGRDGSSEASDHRCGKGGRSLAKDEGRKAEGDGGEGTRVREGTKGTEEEAEKRGRECRVADGSGSPKVKGGRLGKREVPPFLPPSFISLIVPDAAREAVGSGWCHGKKMWGALRSPSCQESRYQELAILREARLNPHSTGKQPAPLPPSPFVACGLSSPLFPA